VEENNEADPQREVDDEEIFHSDESILRRKEQQTYEGLFSYCHFWLSREVPRESLEFVIKSFGGRVSWDGNGKETDKSITHFIADRPIIENQVTNRDYVQPQWVYDSINNRLLLPVHDYAPNTMLPPHLSPFVDDYSIGYVPEYRQKLDQYYFEKTGIRRDRDVAPLVDDQVLEEDEEEEYAKQLAKETAGKYDETEEKKKAPKNRIKTDDELQAKTGLSLLTGGQRRLLRPFKKRISSRNRYIRNLTERRQQLAEGKAVIKNNTFVLDKRLIKPKIKRPSMYHLPWYHPAWRGPRRRPFRRFPRSPINKNAHGVYKQSQRRTVQ
jgi:pescadillo protein